MTVVPRVVSQSDDTSTPDIPEDQLCVYVLILSVPLPLQYMPAAAAAPMQGTYIPQYTAVPASAITVEVRGQKCTLSSCPAAPSLICVCVVYRRFTGLG